MTFLINTASDTAIAVLFAASGFSPGKTGNKKSGTAAQTVNLQSTYLLGCRNTEVLVAVTGQECHGRELDN